MSYLYETHLHTNVGSKCGITAPEDYIPRYLDKGFTGIVVTDHFFNGNCAVDPSLPWKNKVDAYCRSYERAKEEGDKRGLAVFFGMETRLGNDEYLIYGIDKAFLYAHPEIETASHVEQYQLVHEAGGAVVQAHPYRERDYETALDIYPYCVDAFEGYNKENSRSEDQKSVLLAAKYHLPLTAGSDIHNIDWIKEAEPFGVISETKWESSRDYANLLRKKQEGLWQLYLPGEEKRKPEFTLHLPLFIHEDRP